MMRSSVVLPQPDGPSSATSSPVGKSRLTSPSAVKLPNDLWMLRTWMLMGEGFLGADGGLSAGRRFGGGDRRAPFDELLDRQRDERQQGQQRRHRERGRELIFV